MKRTLLNLFALTLIVGGASHLKAQTEIAPVAGEHCCSGGSVKCCGANGCEASGGTCSAW